MNDKVNDSAAQDAGATPPKKAKWNRAPKPVNEIGSKSNFPETIANNKRFAQALAKLVETGRLASNYAFAKKYGLRTANFYKELQSPESRMISSALLTYLVRDYKVSAVWLLTGEGEMLPTW